jgi:hypothetical protein
VKILLVNFNPVVSRLFALCTRDEHIELDEVKHVKNVESEKAYDMIFVDDASYVEIVKEFIENQKIGKKIFISYESGSVPGFDVTLKKPFLPSQILNLMETVTVVPEEQKREEEPVIFPLDEEESEETSPRVPSIFPLATEETEEKKIVSESPHILDSREIEKIKDLLDMEEDVLPFEEELPEEVVEQRKVEAITAQLIAEGLEIVGEEEIVETLHTGKKSKKKKKTKDTGPFSLEEFDAIQKAFREALFRLKPKKIKKLLKGKKVELKLKLKDRN